jgi:hypothetical protein
MQQSMQAKHACEVSMHAKHAGTACMQKMHAKHAGTACMQNMQATHVGSSVHADYHAAALQESSGNQQATIKYHHAIALH